MSVSDHICNSLGFTATLAPMIYFSWIHALCHLIFIPSTRGIVNEGNALPLSFAFGQVNYFDKKDKAEKIMCLSNISIWRSLACFIFYLVLLSSRIMMNERHARSEWDIWGTEWNLPEHSLSPSIYTAN